MTDYAGKIAEFVTANRDWIKATQKEMIADWTSPDIDPVTTRSNANAELYRKIEFKIGVPESDQVAYDFLQDNFNLNTFRGKVETITKKIANWYAEEEEEEVTNPWYGVVSRVDFVPGGKNDPSLVYRGYEFNYWGIEDMVIDMYRDDLKEEFPDDEFLVQINFEVGGDEHDVNWIDWLRDNADRVRGELDAMIFHGISKSWKK